eukprot:6173652-Pleurochrysis_carterae.AAC.14
MAYLLLCVDNGTLECSVELIGSTCTSRFHDGAGAGANVPVAPFALVGAPVFPCACLLLLVPFAFLGLPAALALASLAASCWCDAARAASARLTRSGGMCASMSTSWPAVTSARRLATAVSGRTATCSACSSHCPPESRWAMSSAPTLSPPRGLPDTARASRRETSSHSDDVDCDCARGWGRTHVEAHRGRESERERRAHRRARTDARTQRRQRPAAQKISRFGPHTEARSCNQQLDPAIFRLK